jgi:hypothetical protein
VLASSNKYHNMGRSYQETQVIDETLTVSGPLGRLLEQGLDYSGAHAAEREPSTVNETVRIVALLGEGRDVAGTYGFVRDPVVGDVGTVVFEYPSPDRRVTVQMSDEAGHTLWFADFVRDELSYLTPGETGPTC